MSSESTNKIAKKQPTVITRLENLNIGDTYKYNLNDVGIFKVLAKDEENWIKVVRTQSGRLTGSFPWTEVYPVNEKYTKDELVHIAHALGVRLFESAMSHNKTDKTLPKEFYRNFFGFRHKHEIFEEIVKKGFATKRIVFEENVYQVNDVGIEKFRKEFTEIVNYQTPENRGIEYLKHRINFYSNNYNYNFGGDNASHVISAYLNYFLKGFYMSHTTTICVKRFEKELKAAHKKGII